MELINKKLIFFLCFHNIYFQNIFSGNQLTFNYKVHNFSKEKIKKHFVDGAVLNYFFNLKFVFYQVVVVFFCRYFSTRYFLPITLLHSLILINYKFFPTIDGMKLSKALTINKIINDHNRCLRWVYGLLFFNYSMAMLGYKRNDFFLVFGSLLATNIIIGRSFFNRYNQIIKIFDHMVPDGNGTGNGSKKTPSFINISNNLEKDQLKRNFFFFNERFKISVFKFQHNQKYFLQFTTVPLMNFFWFVLYKSFNLQSFFPKENSYDLMYFIGHFIIIILSYNQKPLLLKSYYSGRKYNKFLKFFNKKIIKHYHNTRWILLFSNFYWLTIIIATKYQKKPSENLLNSYNEYLKYSILPVVIYEYFILKEYFNFQNNFKKIIG